MDKEDTRLKFNDETMQTPEAEWYMSLPAIDDSIPKLPDLKLLFSPDKQSSQVKTLAIRTTRGVSKATKKPSPVSTNKPKGKMIAVLDDEDDLTGYEKPDSDPEDEEDDPTLIDRNKPRPPV